MSTYGEKHSIYRNGGCYCAECEHYDPEEGYCKEWKGYSDKEDFCSKGEMSERVYE